MIFLKNCDTYNNYGFILRIVLTIVSFEWLKQMSNKGDILLILPILLTVLDILDGVFVTYRLWQEDETKIFSTTNCARLSNHYQTIDKLVDIVSYIYAYVYFHDIIKDTLLQSFILYRFIGVILFMVSAQKRFLIVFFDFVKEYMIYKYLSMDNNYVLLACVILKIVFEYCLHIFVNSPTYL